MAARIKGCLDITGSGGSTFRNRVRLTFSAKLLRVAILVLVTRATKGKGGPKAKKARGAKTGET
jgi:hypothetical protein